MAVGAEVRVLGNGFHAQILYHERYAQVRANLVEVVRIVVALHGDKIVLAQSRCHLNVDKFTGHNRAAMSGPSS
jgi:hypothetical protein